MRPIAILTLFALLGLVAGPGTADEPDKTEKPERLVEKAGGFSFVPPSGWTFRKVAGQKFKVGYGPPEEKGLVPQIEFMVQEFPSTLTAFVAGQKKLMAKGYKNYKPLGENALKTDAGAKGMVLLFQRESNGIMLRHSYCYFDLPSPKKLLVMCSVPIKTGDKFDAAFEASFKTWRREKP